MKLVVNDKPIIVALDYDNLNSAVNLAQQLDPKRCRVKVGKELFVACGPLILEKLHHLGFEVFLDLKFHDIPNTVAQAIKAAARYGVWMLNVHTLGGRQMLAAAAQSLNEFPNPPLLIGVTLLTSLTEAEILELGLSGSLFSNVLHLATLAQKQGLRGVVCSALEAAAIKQHLGAGFICVTPGIRLPENRPDDQQRIMTPTAAVANGSDFLVIGRPITQALQPQKVVDAIMDELLLDR